MPVYYSEEIKANNIRLGEKILSVEKLERGLNRLKGALEHVIAMMEIAKDRGYDDPAKLFDMDHYRDIIASVEEGLK